MIRHPARGLVPVLAALPLLLSACTDEPAATTAPGSTPSSGATATDPGDEPAWTLLADTPDGVPLPAGAYALTAYQLSANPARTLAVVQAPEGYQRYEGWTFVSGDEFSDAEPFHAVGFITTDRVLRDPCGAKRHSTHETTYDPGATVADLTEALVAQKGAITSDPAPVTIDGYDGLYLDYRVPDIEHCQDNAWDIFPGYRLTGTGERAGMWILDVDGQRVLIGWVAKQGVTPQQIEEMTRMVTSTEFVKR